MSPCPWSCRAICGRIEAYISCLPPPFHLARPLLSRAASAEARTPARAPSFSVAWCATQPLPELINATTGKLESGQPSLLCKQSMFARWHYLVKRLPLLPQIQYQVIDHLSPYKLFLSDCTNNFAEWYCTLIVFIEYNKAA
ncbi:hypothetical protein B5X24_HaOG215759 [Helicoverpa armigera]|uniref:A to I editase domain-containing protein n=1 Tax=Helicoverpa armigera TaxID=29058 RepID=A0A2W1BBW3_HELAM|nr:hypothetical protein B5X24_HaOG215759 [Helicoverpa armigera]